MSFMKFGFIPLLFFSLSLFAIDSETTKKDTSYQIASDDAVLKMIDSLISQKYFESLGYNLDTNYEFNEADLVLNDSILEERLAKLNRNSPIALDYNEHVKAFINLYVVKRRALLSRVVGLAPTYYPMFEEVLDRFDMPLELKHLAVVESALSPVAKSRVGAQGLWQFMYRTGKMYGLEIDSYKDDRMDPYKATVAACEYMNDLYKLYGDWHLVLAAYNSGPGNVNKAIRRSGGKKDYWEIRRFLPRETRGYVPAFIAVNYALNHYRDHGIKPAVLDQFAYLKDTVHIYRALSFEQIASYIDLPVEQIQFLNPCYKHDFIPENEEGLSLCLPLEKVGVFLANEEAIYADLRRKEVEDSIAGKESESIVPEQLVHVVRSGEFLGSIANKYNCKVSELMAWNNKRSTRINPGDRLTIYTSNPPKQEPEKLAEKVEPKALNKGKYQVHIVRSGDTLWDIAKEYNNISVTELKRLNSHLNFKRLKPGMEVKVKQIG